MTYNAKITTKSIIETAISYGKSVVKAPIHARNFIRNRPQTAKRIAKVSIALTLAVGLTLPRIFNKRYGRNPFLLGTIAIYLFPVKTVGGQLFSSLIGITGILLGLAYANLVLFLARLIQNSHPEHIDDPRRAFLWSALALGAFGCGYVRSKIARSYLGINFFMVVNMFALIRGVDHFGPQFHAFFYVMIMGAGVSMLVSIALWPEDRGGTLKRDTIKSFEQIKQALVEIRRPIHTGVCDEVNTAGIKSAETALGMSLQEDNYEISFSRVDSKALVPISKGLQRLNSTCRIFNSAMRRKHRVRNQRPLAQCSLDTNSDEVRKAFDSIFNSAAELLDAMTSRVEELYRGETSNITRVDHADFLQKFTELNSLITADVRERRINTYRDLEDAACTDQINTTALDVLHIIQEMSETIGLMNPTSRLISLIPRVFRQSAYERSHPRNCYNTDQVDGISRFDTMSRARSLMPPEESYVYSDATTKFRRARIWVADRIRSVQNSRHIKYGIKLMVVMSLLSLPAFLYDWYEWYDSMRAQLAMISALVTMETTRGMTMRTAGMKLCGAVLGACLAWVVREAALENAYAEIGLTAPVGILIGYLVTHQRWAKSGTVCALSYNLILGVATVFKENGHVRDVFARRLLTLPIGLTVATFVHVVLWPYHARAELVKSLGSSLDWLHHLLFAIEASEEHPSLQAKFDSMAQKVCNHSAFASSLLPITHYEVSLGGHWPYQRFENIVNKIFDIRDIILGADTSGDPTLALHQQISRSCERSRAKLLASLCNDLLVISHTLSARLFLPRHSSHSMAVLQEYTLQILSQVSNWSPSQYADVGRLADLVYEIDLLREEVDELTGETQCPKNGLLPQLSFVVRKSRPGTPMTPRARKSMSRDISRDRSVITRDPSRDRSIGDITIAGTGNDSPTTSTFTSGNGKSVMWGREIGRGVEREIEGEKERSERGRQRERRDTDDDSNSGNSNNEKPNYNEKEWNDNKKGDDNNV
ncbi:hypothetical protein BZA77DRAFT_341427 [Pyronema omphalodes]|nr:hypothetical protein BZA77DRAFT_341427 [Pyronema omphalodes]